MSMWGAGKDKSLILNVSVFPGSACFSWLWIVEFWLCCLSGTVVTSEYLDCSVYLRADADKRRACCASGASCGFLVCFQSALSAFVRSGLRLSSTRTARGGPWEHVLKTPYEYCPFRPQTTHRMLSPYGGVTKSEFLSGGTIISSSCPSVFVCRL